MRVRNGRLFYISNMTYESIARQQTNDGLNVMESPPCRIHMRILASEVVHMQLCSTNILFHNLDGPGFRGIVTGNDVYVCVR